jgi:ribonuclease D
MTTSKHLYIDTEEALVTLCSTLRNCPYIAIDTEFLRERTYRPELCLVQIKHDDTIAIDNLSALIELLMDDSVLKVFHAASQDLEIFYLLCKEVPTPIYDTQIAAPLLGYNEQIGYGNLVKERLGVELAKTQTRADWTRRPLPEKQITYALDDVIYLEQIYLDMHAELSKLGRSDWLKPAFAEWENPAKYDQPAGERWKKMRNIQRYKGETLAIIQLLSKWREIKARELNRPRNWLVKDDILCTLAQQRPDSEAELSHIRSLDRKTRERFGEELLNIIAQGRNSKPQPLPPFTKKQKLDASNLARMQVLNAWVHQRAGELNIAAGLLGPQQMLEKMVTGDGRSALRGWRDPLLGEDLAALLQGRASLACTDSGVVLNFH